MIDKPLDEIEESDLVALVTVQVAEHRTLEFKREIGRGDANVAKFLRDIVAMANAQGGDFLIGIEESNGVASDVPGVVIDDLDAEVLRLESILRTWTDPRLGGTALRIIPLANGRHVIAIRVRASLAAPHAVRNGDRRNYFNRKSAGKYEMDAHKLRQAFTANEQLIPRLRAVHATAVSAAEGDDMPFRLNREPRPIVSIVPLAFDREAREIAFTHESAMLPVRVSAFNWIHSLDGLIVHTPFAEGGDRERPTPEVRAYTVNHWRGRVDACWTIGAVRQSYATTYQAIVWPESFEEGLLDMVRSGIAKLNAQEVRGPWVVLATIVGVRGAQLMLPNEYRSAVAWRDGAPLGELVFDHFDAAELLSLFRAFWLLFGEQRPAARPFPDQ
jgi:hypothetical protein